MIMPSLSLNRRCAPPRRHGGVAGAEPIAELGRPDPAGDRPPAASQDGAEAEPRQPRCGPAVEDGGEPGEPLARGRYRMRGCHWRPSPFGATGSVVTQLRALLRLQRLAQFLDQPFVLFPDGRLAAETAVHPVLTDHRTASKIQPPAYPSS